MICKFISRSLDISSELQTHIINCLYNISLWMPNRYLKLTVNKTEKLTVPPSKYRHRPRFGFKSDKDTDMGKEMDIDKDTSIYISPLPNFPHSFIK